MERAPCSEVGTRTSTSRNARASGNQSRVHARRAPAPPASAAERVHANTRADLRGRTLTTSSSRCSLAPRDSQSRRRDTLGRKRTSEPREMSPLRARVSARARATHAKTCKANAREYMCAKRHARRPVAPGRARRTVPFLERFLGVFSFARCDIRERAREDAHARTTRGSRMNDRGLEIKEIGMQKDSPTSPSSSRVVSQRVAPRTRLPETRVRN